MSVVFNIVNDIAVIGCETETLTLHQVGVLQSKVFSGIS